MESETNSLPPPLGIPASVQLAPATSRSLKAFLVGLVLLLAFFLASAPVRNSDFWLPLATGKALLAGHYQLGADPFSYAADGSTWVNHSWLFYVVLYGLYQLLVGTGLAILKP